tara:strand:- start:702 stop:845 length:144 start_codon:yes stop_codon:yes gene_type:complete
MKTSKTKTMKGGKNTKTKTMRGGKTAKTRAMPKTFNEILKKKIGGRV